MITSTSGQPTTSGRAPQGRGPAVRPFYACSRPRLAVRLACVSGLFHLVYVTYLATRWGYMGFLNLPVTGWAVAVTYALSLFPALWLPRASHRRTLLVFFVLYHLFYIPSQFCLLFTGPAWTGGRSAQVALCAGFSLVAASFRLRAYVLRVWPLKAAWFTGSTIALTCVALALILAVVGWSRLGLHGFVEASAMRRAQEQATGLFTWPGAGYLLAWVQYVVAPLLVVSGLVARRPGLVGLAAVAELFIYAATTAKFALLVPALAVVGWLAGRANGGRSAIASVSWATAVLFSAMLLANLLLGMPNRIESVLAYFVERYFGYQGLSTVEYAQFAKSFGYTYWSHVKGIASFVTYPFDRAVPWAVAMYWRGSADISAPSHPWAHDGLLAAGVPGVIAISVVIAVVFWLTDTVAARLRTSVLVPLLLVQAVLLSESSMFTQLLTNGWLLLCALAAVAPIPLRVAGRTGWSTGGGPSSAAREMPAPTGGAQP